jgi:selenocysteine-specific elongation factor
VRGLQVHGQPADHALAGQRTALNLASVTKRDLSRGMMLAPLETFRPTSRVDVKLSLLSSVKPLKDRARVHLHAYTSETIATVVLYSKKLLAPSEDAFAQLRLAESTLLLPGDRFIIRQFSPLVTIGGGVVLDAAPLPRQPAQETFLKVMDSGDAQTILRARIARRQHEGLSLSQLIAETGWTKQVIETHLAQPIRQGHVLRLGDLVVHTPAIEGLKLFIASVVADFHKTHPLVRGIGKEELREQVHASTTIFTAVIDLLLHEKKLEIDGDLVHLPGRGVVMKDDEAQSKKIIEMAFASAGLKVPALKDVLGGLKVDKTRAQKIVTLLLRDKILIKISEDLVFHRIALDDLRRRMTAEKEKSPRIDIARFKDLTGVTRKYAIPLLEYLDREHVTKRVGDERVIL